MRKQLLRDVWWWFITSEHCKSVTPSHYHYLPAAATPPLEAMHGVLSASTSTLVAVLRHHGTAAKRCMALVIEACRGMLLALNQWGVAHQQQQGSACVQVLVQCANDVGRYVRGVNVTSPGMEHVCLLMSISQLQFVLECKQGARVYQYAVASSMQCGESRIVVDNMWLYENGRTHIKQHFLSMSMLHQCFTCLGCSQMVLTVVLCS